MSHPVRVLLFGWLFAALSAPLAGADPLMISVSILPQELFVSRIGGPRVQVEAVVQPGQNPHAYEPTPRRIANLAEADLYVRIGTAFEEAWIPRFRAANPRLRVLDSGAGIELRPEDPGHDHGEDDHGGHDHAADHDELDPHVWTSPRRVRIMAARIRDALTELAPDHGEEFAANYARFAAELDALDARIRARLADIEHRRFMVYHPAWGYFADDYGLQQVAIEREGKEPGARALVALIEQAQREGVRVIFVQPQLDPSSAEQVARSIGGEVAVVDPLSTDYFGTLERIADLIAKADGP